MVKNKGKKNLKLLNSLKGISLDIGCGGNKQPGFVGLDIRPLPGVDIVHDMEQIPYPIPDEICNVILASHVVEHINPARFGFVNVMNEWHRLLKPHGRLLISLPYGFSYGYVQDPTHCNPCNEATWAYFDPTHPSGLYGIYTPKPWKIIVSSLHTNGNMEVVLEKIAESDVNLENGTVVINKKWAKVKTHGGR